MRVGLVGFSQSGKSTLFHALTGVAPDPAAALRGQVGIATVEDARLDFLADMYKPKKKTPATVEFVDTPGLIREQRTDNPQRIATLRTADGLLVVINGFNDAQDPGQQLQAFREELLFADLEVVANRIEKLNAGSKKPRPEKVREQEQRELEALQAIAARLEEGKSLAGMEFTEETLRQIKGFQLFSSKPELVVYNPAEDRIHEPVPESLRALTDDVVVAAAKLELDLRLLDDAERAMFMEELGVTQLARAAIIRKAYDVVGLISFFTVGEDECKAWTIRKKTPAVEAAGKIHTDLARGFIRAELCSYDDLFRLGSMKEVRAKGAQRLEGKEYVVADGDIINFRSGL